MDTTKFIDNKELLPILLAAGMNPYTKNKHGDTYLHIVDDLETAKFLVESDLYINESNASHCETALFSLVRNRGHVDILNYFIQKGGNVNARNAYDRVPLHYANDKNVDILLKAGAKPNLKDMFDSSPLHFAAVDSREIIDSLINAGADPNARNTAGEIPLHIMLNYPTKHTIESLVKVTDLNLMDPDGNTALHLAVKDMIYFIKRRTRKFCKSGEDEFSDIDEVEGKSPHLIRFELRLRNIKLLLEAGADVNIKNNNGLSARDYMIKNCENQEIRSLFNLY